MRDFGFIDLLLAFGAILIFAAVLSSCATCLTPGQMRCEGDNVMVCGGSGSWIATRNCKDVTGGPTGAWVCGVTSGVIVACMPTDGGVK